MDLPTYFADFLEKIRPTDSQNEDYQTGHKTLRDRIAADKTLSPILVSDFLQGSYRRATAVRPQSGKKSDVDVVVVTALSEQEYTPAHAMAIFAPFLDKHYKDKWEYQGRSIGITLSYVELDLVITSAPSESQVGILKSKTLTDDTTIEEASVRFADLTKAATLWKTAPLRIPDREAKEWDDTHPLAQIEWTWDKNARCDGHYVNVVKALKWWCRVKHASTKYPKGYPVEHLIGLCCPNGITSVAQGVTLTLETIVRDYKVYVDAKIKPVLPDHGVPAHDVFARLSADDFAVFYGQVADAAIIARRAYDADTMDESADAWRELFGSEFPPAPSNDQSTGGTKSGGFTPRVTGTALGGGRFA